MRRSALPPLAVTALIACQPLAPQGTGRPLTMFADVVDASASGDVTTRCAEVAARLRPVINDPRTRALDLVVFATGRKSGEPTLLVPWTEYVPAAGLYESPESAARQRAEWILGIERTCAARLRSSGVSPVFEAVGRALEAIEARCSDRARERFRCTRKLLAVQSDLRSTHGAFGAYMRALAASRRSRNAAPPAAPRLSVHGVELSFCGVSNTDAGDGLPAEIVLAAWSSALGTPMVADPTCAVDSAVTGGAR